MKRMSRAIGLVVVLIALCGESHAAPSGPLPANRLTTISGRGVILAGQRTTDVELALPRCTGTRQFLIQSVHAGPEITIGGTINDVVQLRNWGVSVPVFQQSASGAVQVALTALATGPVAASASIPAGQPSVGGTTLQVRIEILGGGNAPARFEWNLHVTGACGVPFVAP